MSVNNNASQQPSSIRRLSILTVLGFSSGLPLSLTSGTLQAWFTQAGVDVVTIGMLSLVGLPYVLKFLWAPMLDRFEITGLGRRRSWMLASQIFIVASICGLASLAPAEHQFLMACFALLVAFFSATQDIAIDAYRTELLNEQERGLGVGLAVAAYRLALIFAGAGALFIADNYDFRTAYFVMAAAMVFGICASLGGPKPHAVAPPNSLKECFWLPLQDLSRRPYWGLIIALIVTYKLGDAFAEKLTMTFFLRELTFSLAEVGALYKTAGIAAAIIGGVLGGILMLRVSLLRALIAFAILQMVTNIGFVLLAILGKTYLGVVMVVIAENFFGGMGTAAFVTLIMALCHSQYTATQFALLTAIASLGRVFAGPIAGAIVEQYSWVSFFVFTAAVGALPLGLLVLLRNEFSTLDGRVDRQE